MPTFPKSTLFAIATFAAILLVVHFIAPTRGLNPATLRPAATFRTDRASIFPVVPIPLPGVPENLAVPNPTIPGFNPAAAANLSMVSPYLVENGTGLDHFYAALNDLANGKRNRPVRIVHYGDSPTTADLITGDARELLQDRFGDAGSGFILIAKPWAWYGHHGVDVSATGWEITTAVGSMREANYGLGGASFLGWAGAQSTIHLAAHSATSIEIQFLQQPYGGIVEVLADGKSVGTVKTAGEKKNGSATVDLPVGTRTVTLRVTVGQVELFGVAFGTRSRGITYDSIGLNGASTTVMSRAFSPTEWGNALQHRDPDLVIINYGTNESSYPAYVDKFYEPELRRAIARVRAALPNTSILVMSPMDRGARDGGSITTMPAIPRLVDIQQRVAAELGCGFFNTYAAMGGNGTMERWYDGHPRMVGADLIHPSPQGARIVAQSLTGQLLIGYERYEQHHPQTGSQSGNEHPAAAPPTIATSSNHPASTPKLITQN